ncbi:uncharacterized protein LOC112511746 [Cynara cardunculus var. scolymus]|uniref:Uncharacterized protein n=1 Tax=Cynara cardunculus var. scolymus TaxID=59895 RepID=A0A103XXN1_CYNCS|nr:uncharacterized protein LOC112511746 [Cynara cardunculus var. scolymus]KVH98759.1 Protein of unknown function DUF688 [Cynara cardunculus var. scolymus]
MTSTDVRRSSRRSPSFSSTSSSSIGSISFFLHDSPPPATPLRYFSGIPFSWEQFPGIPKKNNTHTDSSHSLLPLPPSGNSSRKSFGKSIKKYSTSDSFHKDPFFAAFVECSKDDDHELVKVTKSRSGDRSGLASVYTSCKRTCEVAESIVYLPRSRAGGYFYR